MNDPHASPEVSLRPLEGWHCGHFFYRFDRPRLAALSPEALARGRREFAEILSPDKAGVARLQLSAVSGHKADFALLLLDADPVAVDAVHQRLMASTLGAAIEPTYSFVSLTEVSEYLPTVEQYAERLKAEGEDPSGPAFAAKVKAYQAREEAMRAQRLHPELPEWPATCFYPMNKKRKVGENWFTLDFAKRAELMTEHGRSGMAFAGRVTQLITVAVGFDDWEWGVTLWARNPQFLKDIVYKMRFDEASARYAEFGPFYVSYVMPVEKVLDHCRVGA